jgi:hypothetical protein
MSITDGGNGYSENPYNRSVIPQTFNLVNQRILSLKPQGLRALWLRWVLANAAEELFGLGLTFVVMGAGLAWLQTQGGILSIVTGFVFAIVSGIFEATLVGWGQWWAMRPWFPAIRRGDWWRATTIGALAAYFLGYLPTTIMDLGTEASSAAPIAEPPQAVVLLLAAGMGLAGGAVLSFAQWLVLRKQVRRAGIWIPVNMLAWMLGMPLIFWGIDLVQPLESKLQIVAIMAGVLLAVGIIVCTVHGLGLVYLARKTKGEGLRHGEN